MQLPCICHGSADDPKENATGPFSTFVFDAIKATNDRCMGQQLPNYCNYQTWSEDTISDHINIHFGIRPFQCNKCNKCYNNRGAYHNHMRIHSNERLYICMLCKADFLWEASLKWHLNVHQKRGEITAGMASQLYERTLNVVRFKKKQLKLAAQAEKENYIPNPIMEENLPDLLPSNCGEQQDTINMYDKDAKDRINRQLPGISAFRKNYNYESTKNYKDWTNEEANAFDTNTEECFSQLANGSANTNTNPNESSELPSNQSNHHISSLVGKEKKEKDLLALAMEVLYETETRETNGEEKENFPTVANGNNIKSSGKDWKNHIIQQNAQTNCRFERKSHQQLYKTSIPVNSHIPQYNNDSVSQEEHAHQYSTENEAHQARAINNYIQIKNENMDITYQNSFNEENQKYHNTSLSDKQEDKRFLASSIEVLYDIKPEDYEVNTNTAKTATIANSESIHKISEYYTTPKQETANHFQNFYEQPNGSLYLNDEFQIVYSPNFHGIYENNTTKNFHQISPNMTTEQQFIPEQPFYYTFGEQYNLQNANAHGNINDHAFNANYAYYQPHETFDQQFIPQPEENPYYQNNQQAAYANVIFHPVWNIVQPQISYNQDFEYDSGYLKQFNGSEIIAGSSQMFENNVSATSTAINVEQYGVPTITNKCHGAVISRSSFQRGRRFLNRCTHFVFYRIHDHQQPWNSQDSTAFMNDDTIHPDRHPHECPDDKTYVCNNDAPFNSTSKRIPHGAFECPLCNRIFHWVPAFKCHVNMHKRKNEIPPSMAADMLDELREEMQEKRKENKMTTMVQKIQAYIEKIDASTQRAINAMNYEKNNSGIGTNFKENHEMENAVFHHQGFEGIGDVRTDGYVQIEHLKTEEKHVHQSNSTLNQVNARDGTLRPNCASEKCDPILVNADFQSCMRQWMAGGGINYKILRTLNIADLQNENSTKTKRQKRKRQSLYIDVQNTQQHVERHIFTNQYRQEEKIPPTVMLLHPNNKFWITEQNTRYDNNAGTSFHSVNGAESINSTNGNEPIQYLEMTTLTNQRYFNFAPEKKNPFDSTFVAAYDTRPQEHQQQFIPEQPFHYTFGEQYNLQNANAHGNINDHAFNANYAYYQQNSPHETLNQNGIQPQPEENTNHQNNLQKEYIIDSPPNDVQCLISNFENPQNSYFFWEQFDAIFDDAMMHNTNEQTFQNNYEQEFDNTDAAFYRVNEELQQSFSLKSYEKKCDSKPSKKTTTNHRNLPVEESVQWEESQYRDIFDPELLEDLEEQMMDLDESFSKIT
ncbi:Fez family zinc finger protein 2 [Trichinella britovi]|uniref:Fez family zinc finger protein 2 n=1 Tax=Trichinella britovi TaxID=45882 RepID=A0A0V1D902_TRIBR|nr:Fez family zinc finger protein 2 [Trichinella britovi]